MKTACGVWCVLWFTVITIVMWLKYRVCGIKPKWFILVSLEVRSKVTCCTHQGRKYVVIIVLFFLINLLKFKIGNLMILDSDKTLHFGILTNFFNLLQFFFSSNRGLFIWSPLLKSRKQNTTLNFYHRIEISLNLLVIVNFTYFRSWLHI